MPILWNDCAVQRDHNRCWRCGGYDQCDTDAHREALRNYILYMLPIQIAIDVGIVLAVLRLAGVI